MHFQCPECQARLRGGRPGAVRACSRCGNPVVVPAAPPPPPPAQEPSPAPAPSAPPGAASQRLWRTAGLVVAILALAHIGVYMILTAEARADIARIESVHAREALAAAAAPQDAPAAGTAGYGAWRRAQQLWVDAQAWRTHQRQVGLLRTGFLGSFVVQLIITAWILVRVLGAQRRAEDAVQRAGTRTPRR